MKNPGHPGRHIREELEFLNVSVETAAEALGVSSQHLADVVAGRSDITAEMAIRLEAGIGSTADTWLELQRAFDIARIKPEAPRIAAGVRRLAPA